MLEDKVTFKRAFKCSLEIKCSKVCYPVQRQENLERHGLDDGLRGCCLQGSPDFYASPLPSVQAHSGRVASVAQRATREVSESRASPCGWGLKATDLNLFSFLSTEGTSTWVAV